MEWQQIDTAPKDGTHILLYGTYQWEDYDSWKENGAVVGKWKDNWYGELPEDKLETDYRFWVLVNANPSKDRCQPTHWMPLPPPPKENNE